MTHIPPNSSIVLTVPNEACTQLPSLPMAVAMMSITLEPVSFGTTAGTAPAPGLIFYSATAVSGPSLIVSEEVQSSDFAETAATILQPASLSITLVSQLSPVSPTSAMVAVTTTSMPSSQILELVLLTFPTSDPPAFTKGQKANQATIGKKVAKMQPNNSLTPRYVMHP